MDLDIVQNLGADYDEAHDKWTYQGKTVMPQDTAKRLLTHLHRLTHLGKRKMAELLDKNEIDYYIPKRDSLIQQIVGDCEACAKVNAGRLRLPLGVRVRGHRPGIHWEIDFTEIKPGMYNNRYLLVFIDTFSGWVEAYPTKKETAQVVVKKLLEEIFPRFGLPKVLGSDNGPAFVSQVSQLVAKSLGID